MKEELFFESADAGCAGRLLETAKKYLLPTVWLTLQLRVKKSGAGYEVYGYWDEVAHGGMPQAGPRASYEESVMLVRAFAAGFRCGMGVR